MRALAAGFPADRAPTREENCVKLQVKTNGYRLTDFYPSSRAVLERARALAGTDGTLQLVHSVDAEFPGMDEPHRLCAELGSRAQRELDALAETARGAGCRVEAVIRVGRPATELLA